MTQDFHVLRCCECKIFQVHQVKKSNKWNCKVCGTKQSVRQVYGKGSGADCRRHVQKLNTLRGVQALEQDAMSNQLISENSGVVLRSSLNEPVSTSNESSTSSKGSRWSKFFQDENEHSNSVSDDLKGNEQTFPHVDPPDVRDPHRIFRPQMAMGSTGITCPDNSTLQTEKKEKFISFVSQGTAAKQSKNTITNTDEEYEINPGTKPKSFSSGSKTSKWSHCVGTSDSNNHKNKSNMAPKHLKPVVSKTSKWSGFVQTPNSSECGEEEDCVENSLSEFSDVQDIKNIKPASGNYKGFQLILRASLQSKSTNHFSTDFPVKKFT